MATVYTTVRAVSRPATFSGTCKASVREILIIHTAVPQTLHALLEAAPLAQSLSIPVRLMIPHVVPYPLPLNRPSVDPRGIVDSFYTVAEDPRVETTVDVRLCRDAWEAIHQAITPSSLVVLGSHKRWWPSRESRLAARLRRDGHHVLLSEF